MHELVVDLLARNRDHAEAFRSKFDDLQDAQYPAVVTVCCSDSRVLQDHMWGNDEPGQMFTCSNIGNRVGQRTDDDEVISGDVLYPIAHTGTDTAIVVGHTGCGAVTATYHDLTEGLDELPGIQHCIDMLSPHLELGVKLLSDDLTRAEQINRLVEYNVDRQVELLCNSEDIPEDTTVLGVVYDFQDIYSETRGQIHVVNVDGETDPETLRSSHPEITDRINRLWTY
jgi:carbonic anhydrase